MRPAAVRRQPRGRGHPLGGPPHRDGQTDGGRCLSSVSDALVGCTVWSTTASSSAVRARPRASGPQPRPENVTGRPASRGARRRAAGNGGDGADLTRFPSERRGFFEMSEPVPSETITKLAERLRAAYSGEPVAPVRDELPAGDVEVAYQVQEVNTQHWVANGRRLVGRKIGLTSAAVQRQLGVDQPDFGMLFADMSVDSGAQAPAGSLLQPRVEAEVAFVLGSDLDTAEPTLVDPLLPATSGDRFEARISGLGAVAVGFA